MLARNEFSRRAVLKTLAAGASARYLSGASLDLLALAPKPIPYPENGVLIPDENWYLWVDNRAVWESDEIFLPQDVAWVEGRLCGKSQPLPQNAPTGGWNVLTSENDKTISLPTSVEQHFWGRYGAGKDGGPRPYTPEEYRYAAAKMPAPPADDTVPQNGAYYGVSWFFRPIDIPGSMMGKRIILHIRGAHLRAEVYLNGKLCGYSIMEELPFEADLSLAAKPGGENLLAIRITNPFGRFDWVDGLNAKWGKVSLYRSHGFGALDRGITISTHDPAIRISDAWVLNTGEPRTIEVNAVCRVSMGQTANRSIVVRVLEPETGQELARQFASLTTIGPAQATQCSLAVGSCAERMERATVRLTVRDAILWDFDHPKLYHLELTLDPLQDQDDVRTIAFGFRSFGPSGLGSNAMFRMNGRRIRLYSAISWGFWGLNGMFPVPELAEKEVRAAKALGLNCLNFHRNLAKEDVLRKHDELGVLRYMEPGAGKLAVGRLPAGVAPNSAGIIMEKPVSESDRFAQRYMFTKCVEMVKAFRSHPSVIEYCLQNEIGADLKNPATLEILKAMHDEDPSRCVVLNDGFVARGAAQAWYEPWSFDEQTGELTEGKLHRSDQEEWGGWWNNHQGAGDQWYDHFYSSPTNFTYKAPYKEVLTEYGEMEGCARPDNHSLMVRQIKSTFAQYGADSYDLADHEAIIAGYEQFLDRWGFRKAFPTSEAVFVSVGRTCYESWMNYMENVRVSDALDFAAISGWESTAIENHSGIVDNLRNFKGDPELIRGSLLPVRPIAKQRSLVVERGNAAVFDLFLANDTVEPSDGALSFSMTSPSGKKKSLVTLPAPAQSPDVFSYLVKEDFRTPKLEEEGLYRFEFAISSLPLATQTKELWVTGIMPVCCTTRKRVAVCGVEPDLRAKLSALGSKACFDVVEFDPDEHCDLILSSGIATHSRMDGQVGETTGEQMPVAKPGRSPEPGEAVQSTQLGAFVPGVLDAVREGTPLFAIPRADTLSEGLAKELSAAGAFLYRGVVGDFRAPWMGNWYFVREHPLFAGMPVNAAMGSFYQTPGRQSNGLLIEAAPKGHEVAVIVGYSRDHDRNVGAGTFTTQLGKGKVLFHRVPSMHPVLEQRFLSNALHWLMG
jgi:beta-galactosidase